MKVYTDNMWIVGLINENDCCKTYICRSYDDAKKELDSFKKIFKNNNIVERSTTIVVRDLYDNVEQVKILFELNNHNKYIMFLNKSKDL